jgi:hypothetical protein
MQCVVLLKLVLDQCFSTARPWHVGPSSYKKRIYWAMVSVFQLPGTGMLGPHLIKREFTGPRSHKG